MTTKGKERMRVLSRDVLYMANGKLSFRNRFHSPLTDTLYISEWADKLSLLTSERYDVVEKVRGERGVLFYLR